MIKPEAEILTHTDKLHISVWEIDCCIETLKNIADAPILHPAHIRMIKVHLEKVRLQNQLIALYAENIHLEEVRRRQKQERKLEQPHLL